MKYRYQYPLRTHTNLQCVQNPDREYDLLIQKRNWKPNEIVVVLLTRVAVGWIDPDFTAQCNITYHTEARIS